MDSSASSVDIRRYLRILRRSLWILILCPVISAAVAAGVSKVLPPVYEGHVALLVRPAQVLPVDTNGAALTSDQISRTYATLMTERPLLQQVITELNLNTTPENLAKQIKVTPQPNTTILDVSADSTNPNLARDIANTLVSDFINQMKAIQSQEQSAQNTRPQDNLVVVAPAVTPTKPVSPNLLLNTLLAAAAGLLLGAGIIVLREYLDQTVKSDDDLVRRSGVVPIAHVGFAPAPRARRAELVVLDPNSTIAEAYRVLRTNLLFSGVDRDLRTIVITSSAPGEGKSRTTANLAVALAQAGYRTLLVDADFRRPSQHRILGRVRNVGLSNLMIQDIPERELVSAVEGVPNLHFVASGPTPPNPSELLGSGRMLEVLAHFRESYHYVVIDTPPVNAVTDAMILAARCDGVIFVAESARTTYPALAHAREAIERVRGQILGVVVNKVRTGRGGYDYDGYYAEYGYYAPNGTAAATASQAAPAATAPVEASRAGN
ncbi:MAG TPA: polysaccharide biosynthesis tyrosine autokinase [Candidatus Dormibacteraeota bacterium]